MTAVAVGLLWLNACATGGAGQRRGRVSEVAAQAATEEPAPEAGGTRTKTDHLRASPEADRPGDDFAEDDDDGGSFLGNLLVGLFTRGDDDADDDFPIHFDEPAGPDVYVDDSDYSEFGLAEEEAGDRQRDDTALDSPPTPSQDNLIVWLSRTHLAGDAIARVSTASVMYSGFVGPRFRGHAGLFYGEGSRGRRAVVRNGLKGIREYGVEIGARQYLTARGDGTGPYLRFGLRGGVLHWSYRQGVVLEDGTSVASDGVLMLTPYLGCGSTLVRLERTQLGVGVSWGPRITLNETFEGFDNDLFGDVGELRLDLEVSLFF